MSTILAATSGLQAISDNSGVLYLQNGSSANVITINTSGAIGIGSSPNYGTSGQVLTSTGSGSAPTWSAASFVSQSKAISTALLF